MDKSSDVQSSNSMCTWQRITNRIGKEIRDGEKIWEDPPSPSSGSPVEDEECSRKKIVKNPKRWVWTTGKVKWQHWSKSISDCN